MTNSQIVEFKVVEKGGKTEYYTDKYPKAWNESQCVEAYEKMRYYQSVKGFFRPKPASVEFHQVILVK